MCMKPNAIFSSSSSMLYSSVNITITMTYNSNIYSLIFFFFIILPFITSFCPQSFIKQAATPRTFQQKTHKFFHFEEHSSRWIQLNLPHDLISCTGDQNCTVVGSIQPHKKKKLKKKAMNYEEEEEDREDILTQRKRVSLFRLSESAILCTGESGAIYHRFWNGVQWVYSHHSIPAVSAFHANQFFFALSQTGRLYQLVTLEDSQHVWIEFNPNHFPNASEEDQHIFVPKIKSGYVSHNGMIIYFCTEDGVLMEFGANTISPSWENRGQPPGANVAMVATTIEEVVFTISSKGDLYEYDKNTKPSWKKHIWTEATQNTSLQLSSGWGLVKNHSLSLFLLTKDGQLVERKRNQRKWKWIVHGRPKGYRLTSVTPASSQHEINVDTDSLFFTTNTGYVFEYQLIKSSDKSGQETWVNHVHPQNAKAARGIGGRQLHIGRMVFPLHDGRLGELHLPGLGGDNTGPNPQANVRRKESLKYVWSIIDVPETEGWNAEYCTKRRGPTNCYSGTNDESNDESSKSAIRRRKGNQAQQTYLYPIKAKYREEYKLPKNWIRSNFRLRLLREGLSFFLITGEGYAYECIKDENYNCVWLRHTHPSRIEGALGMYNESLYFTDVKGNMFIRQRGSSSELEWINGTDMEKGSRVSCGPPWNPNWQTNFLFFISENGRLMQFTVDQRKYGWKDCGSPLNSRIAGIVDQEMFRKQIVFVLGRNGRLYQYNKVTELWHEHYQSQHLILSRLPGTAMRPSSESLDGSLFMLSNDGGLVEYHWDILNGWSWVEHGTPEETVVLVTAPGPCINGSQLLLVGSNGEVYLRYVDQTSWKWKKYGFPHNKNIAIRDGRQLGCVNEKDWTEDNQEERLDAVDDKCDTKIAAVRPIQFSDDVVIFELRDGRLAEIRRMAESHWIWWSLIATPESACTHNYWVEMDLSV